MLVDKGVDNTEGRSERSLTNASPSKVLQPASQRQRPIYKCPQERFLMPRPTPTNPPTTTEKVTACADHESAEHERPESRANGSKRKRSRGKTCISPKRVEKREWGKVYLLYHHFDFHAFLFCFCCPRYSWMSPEVFLVTWFSPRAFPRQVYQIVFVRLCIC